MKIHIVQKGDTLWKLAKKYGVQFEELKKLNSQLNNPDMIMPGMKIKIPSAATGHHSSVSKSNTKIHVGSKKEAPIQGKTILPIKEAPKVTAPAKEVPIAAPIKKKESIKPKEMPTMPQPVVPEIDINNYYMVNMANMNVVKSQPQVQSKEVPVVQKEQPQVVEAPVQTQVPIMEEQCIPAPMPIMEEQCIPVTPVMPGAGFCPPFFPMYHPFQGPLVHSQMIQPLCEEESSSMWESSSHPHFLATGNMTMQQPQVQSMYATPYQSTYMPQMPDISAHGAHHQFESSYHIESSSHHLFSEQPTHPNMVNQKAEMANFSTDSYVYNPIHGQPHPQMKDADCGCGGPKSLTTSPKTHMHPTYSGQPMMSNQPMNQGQPMMGNQPMNAGQPMMGNQPMNAGQPMMGNQPMNAGQPMMSSQPMNAGQPMMGNQPMNAGQPMMGNQPMNAGQPMMGNQPMNAGQPMMGNQPMNAGQPMMSNQPMNMGQQAIPTQQPVNPFQPFKSRANPGNVPFLNLEENVYSGMQQPSTLDVLEMPRYADESNG